MVSTLEVVWWVFSREKIMYPLVILKFEIVNRAVDLAFVGQKEESICSELVMPHSNLSTPTKPKRHTIEKTIQSAKIRCISIELVVLSCAQFSLECSKWINGFYENWFRKKRTRSKFSAKCFWEIASTESHNKTHLA